MAGEGNLCSLDLTVEALCLKPKKYGRHLGNVLSTSIKHSHRLEAYLLCYTCDLCALPTLVWLSVFAVNSARP